MKPWLLMMLPLLIFNDNMAFCEQAESQSQADYWSKYKQEFVTDNGRLVDFHQNAISHSEGQGYGLILALHFDDKATFEKIWLWTKNNLQREQDSLFSWSWGKDKNNHYRILDGNNASDGDILIAYALLLAAKHWSRPQLKHEALAITRNLIDKLTIKINGRLFLLPGEFGFNIEQEVKLNPSYQILSAYKLFALEANEARWLQIKQDAEYIINQSFDSKSGLPADWIWLDKKSGQLNRKLSQFGYEAVRIYLYQLWDKERGPLYVPELMFKRFKCDAELFSLYEFHSPGKRYPDTALSGIYQIYAEVAELNGNDLLASGLRQKASQKYLQEKQQYYGQTLYLLSQVRPQ